MNGVVKGIIIFIGGAATGGLAGFFIGQFLGEKKGVKRADAEIASMRKYVDELVEKQKKGENLSKNLANIADKEPEVEKAEDKAKEKPVEAETEFGMDYFKLSKEHIAQQIEKAKQHTPKEREEVKIPVTTTVIDDNKPFVISEEEAAADTVSNVSVWTYYQEDGIMFDEDADEPIVDYHTFIDYILEETGFDVNDQESICIKNPKLSMVIEVNKAYGSYIE